MHILIHSTYFLPEVGGMEHHIYNLAVGLKKKGHHVTLITTRSNRSFPSREIIQGIQVYRKGFGGKNLIAWIVNTLISFPIFLRLSGTAQILHCHDIASAFPGFLAKRIQKKPLVLTFHTSHFLRLSRKPFWRLLFRFLLNEGNAVITPSKEIKEKCLEISPRCNALEVVNRIDTDLFKPTNPILESITGESILLCPRRLYPKNGVEYVIRAMPLIRNKIKVKLYIIGDGPLRTSLGKLSNELGVNSFVSFEGIIQNKEMPAYYSSADLVIIPSLLEATSLAALEAMSCERPVAASRVGGLPEIIDEKVGVLFEPKNPEDLADKVISLLRRKSRTEMGKIARERVLRNWSLQDMIQIHLEKYSSLIQRRSY